MTAWHVAIALFAGIATATPARAQEDPFSGVTTIVEWFNDLNQKWDRIVTQQEREQLLRSLDRVRSRLYNLEGDTRLLLETIPQASPDQVELDQLRINVSDLEGSLQGFREAIRAVGDQVQLNDGFPVERALTRAAASRGASLSYLDRQLANPSPWRANEIITRLSNAVEALNAAQISVTRFRKRLAAQR